MGPRNGIGDGIGDGDGRVSVTGKEKAEERRSSLRPKADALVIYLILVRPRLKIDGTIQRQDTLPIPQHL